jgi:hypothetical protein
MVLSPVLALLVAAANALGSVMQRRAALVVPHSHHLRIGLMRDLRRTPVRLLGIAGVALSAVFRGAALATGALAVVQPLFIPELPFALLVAGVVFGRPLPRSRRGPRAASASASASRCSRRRRPAAASRSPCPGGPWC